MDVTQNQSFDRHRLLKQPNMFQPFDTAAGIALPLREARLSETTVLLIFERGGERRALLRREMAYHHLAQGELGGQPYAIAFCGVCNSGVGLTPKAEEQVLHFRAGGLYNGVVILTDDETQSYWDHITGKAVYGSLTGTQLDVWSLEMTTVGAALAQDTDLTLLRSQQQPILSRAMQVLQWLFGQLNILPSFFLKTMPAVDDRLPKMTMGLGVVVAGEARFYPASTLEKETTDQWNGRALFVRSGQHNDIAYAVWEDGTRPFQLYLRWYGFSSTFPQCQLVSIE